MRESAVPYFIMALSITEVASSLELGMLSILPREKDRAKLIYGERSTFSSSPHNVSPVNHKHSPRSASLCETRDFGTRSTQRALISREINSLVKVSRREPLSGIRSRPSPWKNVSGPTRVLRLRGMNNPVCCVRLRHPRKVRNNSQRIRNSFKASRGSDL